MNKHLVSFAWFLGFLVVTNVVVAPIVRKITPKNKDGQPVIVLI